MTGIAGAAREEEIQAACLQCGIIEGDRKPDGKKLLCLPIAQAIVGIGVVCWCSETCRITWMATRPLGSAYSHEQ